MTSPSGLLRGPTSLTSTCVRLGSSRATRQAMAGPSRPPSPALGKSLTAFPTKTWTNCSNDKPGSKGANAYLLPNSFFCAALALVQNHPTGYPVRTQTSRSFPLPSTPRADHPIQFPTTAFILAAESATWHDLERYRAQKRGKADPHLYLRSARRSTSYGHPIPLHLTSKRTVDSSEWALGIYQD